LTQRHPRRKQFARFFFLGSFFFFFFSLLSFFHFLFIFGVSNDLYLVPSSPSCSGDHRVYKGVTR